MNGDLISREALLESFHICNVAKNSHVWESIDRFDRAEIREQFMDLVKDAPAVDAEPVVKCRDCKHWDCRYWDNDTVENIYAGLCSYIGLTTGCEFYCAKGERDGGAEE